MFGVVARLSLPSARLLGLASTWSNTVEYYSAVPLIDCSMVQLID
jgi:hypothetical protein